MLRNREAPEGKWLFSENVGGPEKDRFVVVGCVDELSNRRSRTECVLDA